MKEEKEDSIDKLFGRGLSDPGDNASYREEDWESLEAMLDGKKPKGITRNIVYLISAIAAMLLLVIGWVYFSPKTNNSVQQVATKKPQVKQDTGKYGSPVQHQEVLASSTLSAGNRNANGADGKGRRSKSFFTLSAAQGGRINTGKVVIPHYTGEISKYDTTPPDPRLSNFAVNNTRHDSTPPDPSLAAVNITRKDTTPPDPAISMAAIKRTDSMLNNKNTQLVSVVDDIKKPRKTVGTAVSYGPSFALSVLASPDVNSVGGFRNTRVGKNAGLMLTVGLSKWSFSTGAVYSAKPYASSFAAYSTNYKFATDPTQVYANCTVLDIPLNVGYQVYNKNRNKFSLGTGLSSYFMLRENYTFDYPEYSNAGPATYNIRNQNQHIFGVLNLNATYQREINSKFGIGIQPYMKLPLTGIGYGRVNLRSAGVAVGATWNIISGKKPK